MSPEITGNVRHNSGSRLRLNSESVNVVGNPDPCIDFAARNTLTATASNPASRRVHRCGLDELLVDPTQTIKSLAIREGKSERSIRMTLRQGRIAAREKERDGSAEFGSNLSRRLQSDCAPLLGPEHRQVGQALDAPH